LREWITVLDLGAKKVLSAVNMFLQFSTPLIPLAQMSYNNVE
jgi:hypothetical protein